MPNNADEKHIQDSLRKLEDGLVKKLSLGKPDLLVSYFDVALAFPGGPHSKSFDYNAIDFNALKLWADQNNWQAETAPEATHEDQQDTPRIRFAKL